MTDERLERLADHLGATAERPVERSAARWLGEAEAIATDVATADLEPAALEKRLDQLAHLLGNVEETGDEEADEHLTASRELVSSLRDAGEN